MPIKLNKPRDYINDAVHYAGAGGIATAGVAASVALGMPLIPLAALGFTSLIALVAVKAGQKMIERGIVAYKANDPDAADVRKFAPELYERSGLKSGRYPVYDFMPAEALKRLQTEEKAKKQSEQNAMLGMMPNAMAMNFDKPIIMITRPLLKLMTPEEEKAVLAHEFSHAAAGHSKKGLAQSAAIMFGMFSSTFSSAMVGFSAGVLPYVASIGVNIAARLPGAAINSGGPRKFIGKLKGYVDYMRTKTDDLPEDKSSEATLKQLKRRKWISRIGGLAGMAASAALLTAVVGPVYLAAFGAMMAISYPAILLARHYQQSNELHADRGAVDLGADPLALATALRKLEIVNKQSVQAAYEGETIGKKNVLSRIWGELNSSHPTTSKRVEKLAQIARKNGASEEAINAAAKAPIAVDAEHNIPPAIIRLAMSR